LPLEQPANLVKSAGTRDQNIEPGLPIPATQIIQPQLLQEHLRRILVAVLEVQACLLHLQQLEGQIQSPSCTLTRNLQVLCHNQ